MTGIDHSSAPDATHFRVGDVWQSPAGTLYLVTDVRRDYERRDRVLMATLRVGADGAGRKLVRRWDSIGAHSGRPWIRESWGGRP